MYILQQDTTKNKIKIKFINNKSIEFEYKKYTYSTINRTYYDVVNLKEK